MRLLFVSSAFPRPQEPERAIYNLRLCRALSRDHEVAVLAPVPWFLRSGSTEAAPSATLTVSHPRFFYTPGVCRSTHAWCLWRSVAGAARRATAGRAPDAIVSYWSYPDGAAAAHLARGWDIPIVMMAGGSDVLVLARAGAHRRRIRRALQQADTIVAVSETVRSAIIDLGLPDDRIAVVPRGVDRALFFPGNRDEARRRLGIAAPGAVFLWVGRFERVKGIDLLIEALGRLGGLPNWRCYIAGDGAQRRTVVERLRRLGLEDRVTLLGAVPGDSLPDWYRAADRIVITSRSEGAPNVLYEARACGRAAIAFDTGGIRELAGGWDRLVRAGDAAALAGAMSDVVTHPLPPVCERAVLPEWRDSAAGLVRQIEFAIAARRAQARFANDVSVARGA